MLAKKCGGSLGKCRRKSVRKCCRSCSWFPESRGGALSLTRTIYHTKPEPYHTKPEPYHTIPYHTSPYHTVPYQNHVHHHTSPEPSCHHTSPLTIPWYIRYDTTIPYYTISYYTISYYTIPYLTRTIPYQPYMVHVWYRW